MLNKTDWLRKSLVSIITIIIIAVMIHLLLVILNAVKEGQEVILVQQDLQVQQGQLV
jgi:hypothetical protein